MHKVFINNPQILKLSLANFRNISNAHFSFGPSLNLIIGHNAAGKTNLLEAISLACSLRNMNSFNNQDLIKKDENYSIIKTTFENSPCRNVSIQILAQGKKATVDDKIIKSSLKLSEYFPLVHFIPHELNMISGLASLRRKALDQACCSLFADHLIVLKKYEKILLQRNQLLKAFPLEKNVFETFTQMLIEHAAQIIINRIKTIHALRDFFAKKMTEIMGDQKYNLRYKINNEHYDNLTYEDALCLLNKQKVALSTHEKIRKTSLFGPHLHDIDFLINDLAAQKICSRGQSRILVLAFKLAQMNAINEIRKSLPIVILDDIISELDQTVRKNLLTSIGNLGLQVFFSATDLPELVNESIDIKIFNAHDGAFYETLHRIK